MTAISGQYKDPVSLLMSPNINLLPGYLGGKETAQIAPVNKQIKLIADKSINKLKNKLLQGLNESQINLKACENLNAHEIKSLVQESIHNHFSIFQHLLPPGSKAATESIEKVIECKNAVVSEINKNLFSFFDKLAKRWPEALAFGKKIENLEPIDKAKQIHDWLKVNGPRLQSKIITTAFIVSLGSREQIPLEIFYLNLGSELLNNGSLIGHTSIEIDGPLMEMLFKTGKHTLINDKTYLGRICAWLLSNRGSTAAKVIPMNVIKECYLNRNAQDLSFKTSDFDHFKKEQIEEIFTYLCNNIDTPYFVHGVMAILNSEKIKKKGCQFTCFQKVNEAIYRQALLQTNNSAWNYLPPAFVVKKYQENTELSHLSNEILRGRCAADIQIILDEACQNLTSSNARELVETILLHHSDKVSTSHLIRNLRQLIGFNASAAKTAMVGIGTISALVLVDIVRGKYSGAAVTAIGGAYWLTQFAKTHLKFPGYSILGGFTKGFLCKGWKAIRAN